MSKRRSHTLEFKREVLSWVFEYESDPKTAYAAPKKLKKEGYQVNRQSIQGWINTKDFVMDMNNKKLGRRISGGGRKCMLGNDLEDELAGLISKEREEGNRVNGSQVKEWAVSLAEANGVHNFAASDGWLSKFLCRNGFSFRRITNLTSLSPQELCR